MSALWLTVGLLLGSAATGAALAEGSANSANAASTVEPVNRGILLRVEHDGHAAYLFGTIHVGQASFYPLEPVVQRALAGAHSLA
ncbi:MAG: TraB/GumN family protein, partial [Pseudomonadota bacterium]|nr:TraB/GumN family protein [Pseudomonadota bacterium]